MATDHRDPISLDELENAVRNFTSGSKQPSRSRRYPLPPLVTSICSYAYEQGLPAEVLSTLLESILSPNHLDQSSVTLLIKGLYPAERVPSSLIFLIVGSLGQGNLKPSPATQNLLLRWLIMTYDALEDLVDLIKLYSVLFNLMDMISIRANLCHILALLTRRKHVKPFRMQMLMELSRNVGNEPAILGFLRVYKEYYPDVIIGQSTTGRVAKFEYPDPEWRDRLRAIQEANTPATEHRIGKDFSFRVVRRGAKRARMAVVPEVHTYRADETSVTMEEVDGVEDFIEKFDRVELPSQMISVLDDPLLQKFASLRDSVIFQRRLDQWLILFLDSYLDPDFERDGSTRGLTEVLEKILSYSKYTKVLPEAVIRFLARYMGLWDGERDQAIIRDLLAHLPLQDFKELQKSILNELEDGILDNTPARAIWLLSCYTLLLRNWTSQLLALPESNPSTKSPDHLGQLAAHASLLSLHILVAFPATLSSVESVLSYHVTLADTISHASSNPQIRIITPRSETVYLLVFLLPSLSVLSSLTSLLATYKLAFETTMSNPPAHIQHEYPRDYVNAFNGFLMDLCNLLWRSRAFNTTDVNAVGCRLPGATFTALRSYTESLRPPQALQGLFSLSYNPSIVALSNAAFRDLEDGAMDSDLGSEISTRHAGPVSQRSLAVLGSEGGIRMGWAEYRLEVLKWLGERGAQGISELMFCTMKHLMGQKGAAVKTGAIG